MWGWGVVDRPSGTVTFLFTDIEGSTRLWEEFPGLMSVALARHDELLRLAVDSFGGFVFSTGGDGLAAAFGRAGDAVGAAVMAQRALLAEVWPDGVGLRVRMGLHTGECTERDGDYFGSPVNRAARVMAAAHGGQVVVSEATASVMDRSIGVELIELGAQRLHGVPELVRVFGVQADGVVWLDRALMTVVESVVPVAGNLPVAGTEWFGSVAGLQRRVSGLSNRRLVTLTGTGGVGKTRSAIEAGWLVADEFAAGVWFVELAPVGDPDAVVGAVASTLSIQPQESMSLIDTVVDWLHGRRLLLILDNCEHVLGAVAGLVTAIGVGAPTVTVLATSREPLGVSGERVVPIASLDPLDAVSLFIDRATAADDSTEVSAGDRVTIVEICRRLDGIPLAIELAAARMRSLGPADLLARLDDRFRLLRGAGRGGIDRHQTLRATVTWSYQLFGEPERLLFDRLSVFAGAFDLGAVEQICADDILDELDVIDVLTSLVDKSMVIADRGGGSVRYRLLETLRQFGEERLDDRADTGRVRDRHLAYCTTLAETANRLWVSPRQAAGKAMFNSEWDNIRAAVLWAVATTDIGHAERATIATYPFAILHARHEHAQWATMTLSLDTNDRHPNPAVYGAASDWGSRHGDPLLAIELARTGIANAVTPTHPDTTTCWAVAAANLALTGQDDDALAALESAAVAQSTCDDAYHRWRYFLSGCFVATFTQTASLPDRLSQANAFAEQIGAPFLRGGAIGAQSFAMLFNAANAHDPAGLATAKSFMRHNLPYVRESGDDNTVGFVLGLIASANSHLGSPDTAATCHEAITFVQSLGMWLVVWAPVEHAALHLASTGRLSAAATITGHIDANIPLGSGARRETRDRTHELLQHDPDTERLIATGAAMSRDECITYTLEQLASIIASINPAHNTTN